MFAVDGGTHQQHKFTLAAGHSNADNTFMLLW
jgi:hypothetical protein